MNACSEVISDFPIFAPAVIKPVQWYVLMLWRSRAAQYELHVPPIVTMAVARLLVSQGCGGQLWNPAWPVVKAKREQVSSLLQLTLRFAFPPIHSRGSKLCSKALRESLAVGEPDAEEAEDPFAELNVKEIADHVGRVRVRQHVNPLQAKLMAPVTPPKWEQVYDHPALPLAVDIGCGSGRFVMMLAKRNPESLNFLGLDVREKLVDRSRMWAQELHLRNVHFMLANATFMLDSILSAYPGSVTRVSILCPDPHFKKRHHKRRIVQKPLVDAIVKHLAPGGHIFVQSDVKEVAEDMRQQFDELLGVAIRAAHEDDPACAHENGWLRDNPIGIPTEREMHALAAGETMYRLLYTKL